MACIQKIVLSESIKEKRDHICNTDNGPRCIVDITKEDAIIVQIEIKEEYSAEKIKAALTKIFEKAIEML